MKQLIQSVRRGTVDVVDVPVPQLRGSGVLVRTAASLISAGTERAALAFARGSLVDKARRRPDLFKQVLAKARRDGFAQAFDTAMARLDRPVAPGYACAGAVVEVASEVHDLRVGDRVACAGAGYATHAELNFIPRNLVVPIPKRADGEFVGFDEAAFTTLGAIALHGARLAQPQLGDRAVVIGLGAVGLLALQVLRAHGCRVFAADLDPARCDLARALGADDAVAPRDAAPLIAAWTRELGADLVLVTAASAGSEPAMLAAGVSRDKGRVVVVGATGLDLPRRILYEKELSFVVSRSYGPGRYDREYEEHGRDYPLPYVRWTERENMRAFLDLVADGSVNVRALISHRFPIAGAEQAYETLERERVLGILLEYPDRPDPGAPETRVTLAPLAPLAAGRSAGAAVSFIGTGNFARSVLLPAFARHPQVRLCGAVAATGVSARSAADRFGFAYCSTSPSDVWNDDCNAVVIATRHDAHARLVIAALEAGKAVLVEKPLCVHETELDEIERTVERLRREGRAPFLMVGFNRRFAPAIAWIKPRLASLSGAISIVYRVNAGRLPHGSWMATANEGGGRIVGEVCHFVDLCSFLAGAPVVQVSAARSSADANEVMATLRMSNGAIAAIAYVTGGDPTSPKERIEIFGGSTSATVDDFRQATTSAGGRRSKFGGMFARQDKGHRAEIGAFIDSAARRAVSPVSFESAVNSTRATLAILSSLETGTSIHLDPHSSR
jgi:predicted dehydrogenase/threonine dehydrogenase-like Zn-dependent dehydrogenase